MKYLLEYSSLYKPGDLILIEYWYNGMITPVKIIERKGSRVSITHNVEDSKIKNAPDELIKIGDIIDHYRKKKKSDG